MAYKRDTIGFSIDDRTTGTVYYAPEGTTLPTDATTALSNTFVNMGKLSVEGITEVQAQGEDTAVEADGGETVAYLPGEYTPGWTMNLLQYTDFDADKIIYGIDNVVGTEDAYQVKKNQDNMTEGVFVIDRLVGKNSSYVVRTVIPSGTLKKAGDVVHSKSNILQTPVRISATADNDGNSSYEYKAKKSEVAPANLSYEE